MDEIPSAENLKLLSQTALPFNEHQMKYIACFRERINLQITEFKPHATVIDDINIFRYLLGLSFQMNIATSKFIKMLEWRRNNRVDCIREELLAQMKDKSIEGSKHLEVKDLPLGSIIEEMVCTHFHHCNDKEGRPVQIMRCSDMDLQRLIVDIGVDTFLQFNIYLLEFKALNLRKSTISKNKLMKQTMIFDLNGLGSKHLNKIGTKSF